MDLGTIATALHGMPRELQCHPEFEGLALPLQRQAAMVLDILEELWGSRRVLWSCEQLVGLQAPRPPLSREILEILCTSEDP